jgi:DNA-binding beta-propeller fold protein YncE
LAGSDFEGNSTKYYLQHFGLLLSFINDYFYCGGGKPENVPKQLYRIASGAVSAGQYYITDPGVGSLFIYDVNMVLQAEITGLNKPLGVAVDSLGYVLVANDGRDNIEVYDPVNGDLVAEFGQGLVRMPNAITIDNFGNIYVTESRLNTVRVFDSAYNPVRAIGRAGEGASELHFPVDAEVIGDNLFVADQGHARVQVYDLEGNWQRSITFDGTPGINCNRWTGVCEIPGVPAFKKLQALDTDSFGRLHVLDKLSAVATIFDPTDGTFLGSYGSYGTDPGSLKLPMDVLISETNMAIVTAGDGDRIEVFPIP